MDNKSIEILHKLKGYLAMGALSADAFPKDGVMVITEVTMGVKNERNQ